MRLMLREGGGGNTLNVVKREKACVALMGMSVLAAVWALARLSWVPKAALALLWAVIVALNLDLYRFMSRCHGKSFALAVVPLHFAYLLTSGFSVILGYAAHRLFPEPSPSARSLALKGGVRTWPPVPVRPRTSIWDLKQ